MTIRALEPSAGMRWLKEAVNLGRNNPKAIFGGAALLLCSLLVFAIGMSLLLGAVAAVLKPGTTAAALLGFSILLPLMLLMAGLMVGYLRLLDAVENGRAARAMDVFAGFRDLATSGRAIGFVLLLTIVQNVLLIALIALVANDFGSWYLQNLKGSMAGVPAPPMAALPDGFGLAFGLIMVVNLFFYAMQAIGLGQIALRRRDVFGAFADGMSGTVKNLLPLLVFALLLFGIGLLFVLMIVLVAALVGLLAKVVGVWIMVVIGVPLYLLFVLAMVVVMFGVMYFLWRDVSGEEAAPRNDAVMV